MDDYDSMLEEDGATNRLQVIIFILIMPSYFLIFKESLELFSTVTSSTYFADKGWILFLNKKDLFEEKIKVKPLNKFFSNVAPEDGANFEKASTYILDLYRKVF